MNSLDIHCTFIVHSLVIPPSSTVTYTYYNKTVTNITLPILQPIIFIPHSQTDYYFFESTPPFPRLLSIHNRTGIIRGMAIKEMEEIKYRISAYSVTSVVVTELTLRFVMENATIQNDLNCENENEGGLYSFGKNGLSIHHQSSSPIDNNLDIHHNYDSGSENEHEHNSLKIAMNGEIWNSKNGIIRVFERYDFPFIIGV